MNIEIKYNIGDRIQWRNINETDQMETCSFCNGTGEVQGADNTILPCPKCHGLKITAVQNYTLKDDIIKNFSIEYDPTNMAKPKIYYLTQNSGYVNSDIVIGLIEPSPEIGN